MSELEEFCDHCAIKHGVSNSFVGLAKPGKLAHVICKGCGMTTVNHHGHCLQCKPSSRKKLIFSVVIFAIILMVYYFLTFYM